MNVVYHRALRSRIYCYVRVIRETCNTSAADINVLKTILYFMKFSGRVSTRCTLGESLSVIVLLRDAPKLQQCVYFFAAKERKIKLLRFNMRF